MKLALDDGRLADLSALEAPALQRALALLNADGEEARLIGGAVRDLLLGQPPGDFDLATTATPDVVMARAKAAGIDFAPTGVAHGTVTLSSRESPSRRRPCARTSRPTGGAPRCVSAAISPATRAGATSRLTRCRSTRRVACTTTSAASPTSQPSACASSAPPRAHSRGLSAHSAFPALLGAVRRRPARPGRLFRRDRRTRRACDPFGRARAGGAVENPYRASRPGGDRASRRRRARRAADRRRGAAGAALARRRHRGGQASETRRPAASGRPRRGRARGRRAAARAVEVVECGEPAARRRRARPSRGCMG